MDGRLIQIVRAPTHDVTIGVPPEIRIRSILEQKEERASALNIRLDRTVSAGEEVTRRLCNENCVFSATHGIVCHSDNFHRGAGIALSNEAYIEMVKRLHVLSGKPVNIHIAGDGEPTLFERELLDLISSLRELPEIQLIKLTSNGTRLASGSPTLANRLRDAGLNKINMSMHSTTQEGYRRVTGRDLLDSALVGLSASTAAGIQTTINCVVREETLAELEKYIELSRRMAVRIKLFRMIASSSEGQAYADLYLDKMRESLKSRAQRIYEYTVPEVGTIFLIDGAIVELKDGRINVCPKTDCTVREICQEGCRDYARITPTGVLQPCSVEGYELVDLVRAGDSEIVNSLREGGKI
jgi:molybdenum cofactor biosynthesis enzyme MoaA